MLITAYAGPANEYLNGLFGAVTICVPGTQTCQTIDGVLIDTGSSGLRLLSSVVTLPLPQQTDISGHSIMECGEFVNTVTWGPVQTADIKMAGEQASAVPVQIIGGPSAPAIPDPCTATGLTPAQTLQDIGANGILGVGIFRQDCGAACTLAGASNPGFYFSCAGSTCTPTTESLTQQLQNPVWMFAKDNNGVLINLPSVPLAGAVAVNGSMIFGIGTQPNNGLGSAQVTTLRFDGTFSTTFNNQLYTGSFVDSGSNGIFFLDAATLGLPVCADASDFYCPPAARILSATTRGQNNVTKTTSFSVVNADPFLASATIAVAPGIAGPNPGSFDFGLPFFLGKPVFTAIEGQATPGGAGPYFAF